MGVAKMLMISDIKRVSILHKTKLLVALWIAIYVAFTFERPGVGQGPPLLAGTTIWIPLVLWGLLYFRHLHPNEKCWKMFEGRFWKFFVLGAISITPFLDLLFRYTSLVSPIMPGTFTSVGLMGVIMLLVWNKYPSMNFRVFAIGVIASFLALFISELEYQVRFTLHFFNQPLSWYDVIIEVRRLPIVLIPSIYVIAKHHILPTKYTWGFVLGALGVLAIIWHSQYFLMYWSGTYWAQNDINAPIFILNRIVKLLYAGIVISFDYSRSLR